MAKGGLHTANGPFDAKPYPVTGDPDVTYRAYESKGDRTLLFANMKATKR
jgi:hypothetical protein